MTLDRLSSEDAAILALESPVIAGHTCKLLVLAPPAGARPTVGDLRAHIAARLWAAPRMRRRLAPTPLGLAPPALVDDPDFDLARHVRRIPGSSPVDAERLRAIAAREMETRLDRAHPLWCLDVVEELDDGGMALLLKLHHALADGGESVRLMFALLWDGGVESAPARPSSEHRSRLGCSPPRCAIARAGSPAGWPRRPAASSRPRRGGAQSTRPGGCQVSSPGTSCPHPAHRHWTHGQVSGERSPSLPPRWTC